MLLLNANALSPLDRLLWSAFLRFVSSHLIDKEVHVMDGAFPMAEDTFTFISSSRPLSWKLLTHTDKIILQPQGAPVGLDHFFYHCLLADSGFLSDLKEEVSQQLGQVFARSVDSWWRSLCPAYPRVSLITSVYDGDCFIEGFLENMASQNAYDDCEHLFIRPASPGHEHQQIIEHIGNHPGAIYLNLNYDPGLYCVWNLAILLARAPYLTNANLDDRRAPDQLQKLTGCMDRNPECAAASSPLRISETTNRTWEQAVNSPIMFTDVPEGRYSVDKLFRRTTEGVRPRNLLHCMPVWRRRLHLDYGGFDEKHFGPSADWEFWLRCGSCGEQYYFLPQPLGVYLKHPASYWRREKNIAGWEQAIVQRHNRLFNPRLDGPVNLEPAALRTGRALDLLRKNNRSTGLLALLDCVRLDRDQRHGANELLAKALQKYFGIFDIARLTRCTLWNGRLCESFEVFLELVNACSLKQPAANYLPPIFADFYELTGNRRWLLLWAYLARKLQQPHLEAQVLKHLAESDPPWFWKTVQSVYHFTVPLHELTGTLSPIKVSGKESSRSMASVNLVYYPEYLTTNMYQHRLYNSVRTAGGELTGVKNAIELDQLHPKVGLENIFHLHWINAIFRGCDLSIFAQRARQFLRTIEKLKQRGFKFYWSVHNRISHECISPAEELQFRRELSRLADRVYLHHPLIAHELGWLENFEKSYLVEHGPYEVSTAGRQSWQSARTKLGLEVNDFVLVHVGRMRDYKALHEFLPVVLHMMKNKPNMKVILAGKVSSKQLTQLLSGCTQPNLTVDDRLVPQHELETYMAAADFGFLSYRDILTSGALFHWLSCGKPVIGPVLGTIPAYLIDGWNGFLYRDSHHLYSVLEKAGLQEKEQIANMQNNALQVAQQLRWDFF